MNKTALFLAGLCAIFLMSCNSTRLASSWREPDRTITSTPLNKILIVAMVRNETTRRKAEDEVKKYLQDRGVVSYNYLDEHTTSISEQEERQIINKIRGDGFDGAITLRLVDVD